MALPITIRQVSVDSVIPMRYLVLWPSLGPDGQTEPYDTEATTLHYGVYILPQPSSSSFNPTTSSALLSKLSSLPEEYQPSAGDAQLPIAISTITLEPYKLPGKLPASTQGRGTELQLHKVAVHPDLQGLGVGKIMLSTIFELLRSCSPSQASSGNPSPTSNGLTPKPDSTSNGLIKPKITPLPKQLVEKWSYPLLLHFDARSAQRGFYLTLNTILLDPEVFVKQRGGPTGVKNDYVRMGILLG